MEPIKQKSSEIIFQNSACLLINEKFSYNTGHFLQGGIFSFLVLGGRKTAERRGRNPLIVSVGFKLTSLKGRILTL